MGPDIIALAVQLRGIVRRKEDIEQIAIAQQRGIKRDAQSLCMAGVPAADLLVSWVRNVTANIAAFQLFHADQILKHCLHTPEATSGKNRGLGHALSPLSFR